MASDRLPPMVACCSCGDVVRYTEARREVVAWVLAGKGGSLSNPRGQRFTSRWLCRSCEIQGKWPDAASEQPLLDTPAPTQRLSVEETAAHVARLKAKLA